MLFQTIASDKNGNQVDAARADRSSAFFCPSCAGLMILRRGQKNIAHFAHKNLTPNCTPETILHILGKEKVQEVITEHIKNKHSFQSSFVCDQCYGTHEYNLLEGITSVALEKSLATYRPDVSLIDSKGNTQVAVEIVVTHAPERKVIELYNERNVLYVRINLSDYSDLETVESKLSYISNGNQLDFSKVYSSVVECETEEEDDITGGQMFIIQFACEKCTRYTKVALINASDPNPFERIDPEDFSKEQRDLAIRHGVNIRQHKFSKNGDYYYINACSHCNRLPIEASRGMIKQVYGDEYINGAQTEIIDLE